MTKKKAMEMKVGTLQAFGAIGPKSVCRCGHLGDGARSDHGGLIGHGPCAKPGCDCGKFTWDRWAADLQIALARIDAQVRS